MSDFRMRVWDHISSRGRWLGRPPLRTLGTVSTRLPTTAERTLQRFRVDFAPTHRHPSAARVLLATIASVAFSLAADALVVAIGTRVFPSTRGYVHFAFADYAKLTVAG